MMIANAPKIAVIDAIRRGSDCCGSGEGVSSGEGVGLGEGVGFGEVEVEFKGMFAGMVTVCVLLHPLVAPLNSYPEANSVLLRKMPPNIAST
jgi:hypothetical protein